MVFMRRFFVSLFLALSTFIVISCFVTKSRGKEHISFNYVLQEFEQSRIGFNIEQDIKDLGKSMNAIASLGDSSDLGDVLKGIGNTIYYFGRFVVHFVFDTLVASVNIIILILRCVGFTTLDYILLEDNEGLSNYPSSSVRDTTCNICLSY